jgi:hypothetical protein
MSLTPQINGTVAIRSSAVQFLQAFQQRVTAGLLTGKPASRSNYRVVGEGPDSLRIHAVDWWTAINVGLNELELRLPQTGSAHYRVRYWRWAAYVVGLSGILGLIGVALLLTFDVRAYIAEHTASRLPGLSTDQNLLIAWTMVLFWGFVWPWVLIAVHKRPLHRLVARLVGEVDASAIGR